ncbi:sensor domain-containing diguanylate cyclase [Nitrincola tapanii]|uniref:diguanylate cyclase n=1 Tax=Nitrincola tapanii TaxID=1708751 RepID=A0A5A9W6I1_9GAMM|nr:sensor domain-containing diguanylate cyclase [Nitrincola tapanii]KAA0875728.1 sensor domain-containing diguanylate cyclase [Nitrincola tapanii]
MSEIKRLREENRHLHRLLNIMQHKAADNEQLLQALFNAQLRILSCTSLAKLVEYLTSEFRDQFQLCAVNLILLDPEEMAQECLDSCPNYQATRALQLLKQPLWLPRLFPNQALFCGEPDGYFSQFCFPNQTDIASCALLPLMREECLIGCLALGSREPERYTQVLRYDYISHLAAVVSLALEQCISREILHKHSNTDALTRVLNRRAFNTQLIREIKRCQRTDENLICVLVDIDHFKQVNDQHGHLTGDKILRAVARLLQDSLRSTDTLARFGGEEFAILLPGCGFEEALRVVEGLRQRIESEPFHTHQNHPLRITASFGFTLCEARRVDEFELSELIETLLQNADQALYVSKHQGRNQTHFQALPPRLQVIG